MKKKDQQIAAVSKLVFHALRTLREPGGSSISTIRDFLYLKHGKASVVFADLVPEALKKGVDFGAIKSKCGKYKIDPTMALVARKCVYRKPPVTKKKKPKVKGAKKKSGVKRVSARPSRKRNYK